MKACEGCDGPIPTKGRSAKRIAEQRFCSRPCEASSRAPRRVEQTKNCEQCGNPYTNRQRKLGGVRFDREGVSVTIHSDWTMADDIMADLRRAAEVPWRAPESTTPAPLSLALYRVLLLGRQLIEPWPFLVMARSDVEAAKAWGLV